MNRVNSSPPRLIEGCVERPKDDPSSSRPIARRCGLHEASETHRAKYSARGVGYIESRPLPADAYNRRIAPSRTRRAGASNRGFIDVADESASSGHRGESTIAIAPRESSGADSANLPAIDATAGASIPASATRRKESSPRERSARSRKSSPTSIPASGVSGAMLSALHRNRKEAGTPVCRR